MSFTFTVPHATVPSGGFDLLARSMSRPLATSGDTGSWPPGLLLAYSPGTSTRPIELDAGDGRFEVRVLACATRDDHLLGAAMARRAAIDWGEGSVVLDGEDTISADEVPARCDREWAHGLIAAGAMAVERAAAGLEPGQLVRMAGPVRTFALGPRLLSQLRTGPDVDFAERLLGAMQRTQWPGDCRIPSVMRVTDPAGDGHRRFAVLSAGAATLIPDVDAVAVLVAGGGSMVEIEPDRLVELLPGRAQHLDEVQVLVQPLDGDELADLAGRAAATPPAAAPAPAEGSASPPAEPPRRFAVGE